jgi:hypothetical protein
MEHLISAMVRNNVPERFASGTLSDKQASARGSRCPRPSRARRDGALLHVAQVIAEAATIASRCAALALKLCGCN